MDAQIVELIEQQNEMIAELVKLNTFMCIALMFIGGYCIFDAIRYQILRKVV